MCITYHHIISSQKPKSRTSANTNIFLWINALPSKWMDIEHKITPMITSTKLHVKVWVCVLTESPHRNKVPLGCKMISCSLMEMYCLRLKILLTTLLFFIIKSELNKNFCLLHRLMSNQSPKTSAKHGPDTTPHCRLDLSMLIAFLLHNPNFMQDLFRNTTLCRLVTLGSIKPHYNKSFMGYTLFKHASNWGNWHLKGNK